MGFGWLGTVVTKGRFSGVVGKVVLMFGFIATVAAGALWQVGGTSPGALAAFGIVLLACIVVGMVLYFAHLHPDLASLDSGHWLQYQQMIQSKGSPPQLPSGSTAVTVQGETGESGESEEHDGAAPNS